MSDEEIAEGYARTECCNSCTASCEYTKCNMFCNVRNAVLYGLAKGREEKYNLALSQIRHDREKVIEHNERLQKENTGLKTQIEKMKCCENCSKIETCKLFAHINIDVCRDWECGK